MAENFDLVIIGSGNAGYIPAIRASQLGMSVALVEREQKLGGTCLNWGCIPTKALLHTAEKLDDIRHGDDLGINATFEFDYAKTAERRDAIVGQLQQGVNGLMKKNKVKVYTGAGRFIEPKKIAVDGEDGTTELEAGNVLIAVGSSVSSLPGLEFDGDRILSSDDIVQGQDAPPESIVILGSGAVGTEFASMYSDFGTEVTLVEVLDRIVPGEDPEISEQLTKSFKGRGMNVLTSTKADPQSLEKTDKGIRIRVEDVDSGEQREQSSEGGSYGGGDAPVGEASEAGGQVIEAEKILVAVGRKTNVEGAGLENTKVQTTDRGVIQVDGHYQTDEPGVYAAGDVVGGYWLAHAAGHEGITAVEHMAGEDPMPLDQDLVPRVTFCRPEVASFGLTKQEAEDQGYEVKESKFPFRAIGKALIEGDPNGFFKVVADAESDMILGMHAIGPKVTDLISEGVFAKLVEGTPQEIGMAIHPHPALSEVIGESAMAVDGNAIHF